MEQSEQRYIRVGGRLMDLRRPRVMGIVNATPDSFYAQSRATTEAELEAHAEQMAREGADLIDVGAYSSRPGAGDVSAAEEMSRLRQALPIVSRAAPGVPLSVDTFRADVARMCVEEYGVAIVNDISGGELDADMLPTVARLGVPYVLMHMQGRPATMQAAPRYTDVVVDVMTYLARRIDTLRQLGARDIIVDPGFGFGKSTGHNYRLLHHLSEFRAFGLPVLVGVSRKSMIRDLLGVDTAEALNGTTVVNTICLMQGADIVRVHDVRAAREAVTIYERIVNSE